MTLLLPLFYGRLLAESGEIKFTTLVTTTVTVIPLVRVLDLLNLSTFTYFFLAMSYNNWSLYITDIESKFLSKDAR